MTNEYIYIVCTTRNYISHLRMNGPIVHPVRIEKKLALAMIMAGHKVYEYDMDTKETVLLTIENIELEDRFGRITPVAEGNKVQEPIVITTNTGIPKEPEFTFNTDGTVDESVIDWKSMSNSQKKRLRNKIAEVNAAAKKSPVEKIVIVEESTPVATSLEAPVAEHTIPVANEDEEENVEITE